MEHIKVFGVLVSESELMFYWVDNDGVMKSLQQFHYFNQLILCNNHQEILRYTEMPDVCTKCF